MRFATPRVNSGATKKSPEIFIGRPDFPSWGMDGYVRIRPRAGNATTLVYAEKISNRTSIGQKVCVWLCVLRIKIFIRIICIIMKYNIDWLTDRFDCGEKLEYIFFWGHANKKGESVGKFIFSQWYPSPFTVDGITYATAEHWMMAQKAKLFNDDAIVDKIFSSEKPGEVKAFGRQVRNFDEAKWNAHKYEIVVNGSIHKFHQNKILKDYLLNTGDRILVEASPSDAIWGIGLDQNEQQIENPHTWVGTNLLGFALMEARDFLKQKDLGL
jgi:ribA/ribD-fused uncharacterized protein